MTKAREIGFLLLILAAAAVLRLLWLDAIPGGWHHDEALMGIMSSEVYRGIQRPIFFSAYLGQEPLYVYLSAGMMWLMGGDQGVMPLRITSAVVGLGTVVVAYLLGRELYGRRVGLLSAAFLATSFWQITLSRSGYRVITQPLLEGLTVFFVWRAFRHDSWRYAVAAGVCLGGTLYTYLGARLFPGVLLLFAVWYFLAQGRPSRSALRKGAVLPGVAFAVVAPLLYYFLTHPGTFSARINQVFVMQPGVTEKPAALALGENILKLLASFTFYGETLWRYNIAGRAFFVGAVAAFFCVGIIVLVRRVLQRDNASALMAAWFVAMLFPSFLSYDVGAYTFRSMGLVPMLFLIPAIGLDASVRWFRARSFALSSPRLRSAVTGLVLVVVLADGAVTYRDYFVVWANTFGGQYEDMEDIVATASFLNKEARPDAEDIYVSSDYYPHPVLAQLASGIYPYIRWFDGNSTVVLSPTAPRDSLYVFPYAAMPKGVDAVFPADSLVARSEFKNGTTEMLAYRVTPGQVGETVRRLLVDPSFTRANARFGESLELLGYQVDQRAAQGEKLGVTAIWRVLRDPTAEDISIFAHLRDQQGTTRSQIDSLAFPTQQWRKDDVVIGHYPLAVGGNLPAGKYAVFFGAYFRSSLVRLGVDRTVSPEDAMPLGYVKVATAVPNLTQPPVPKPAVFARSVDLLGYGLRQIASGDQDVLRVDLHWQAKSKIGQDYTVFVQLLDASGKLAAQGDSQPVNGGLPTSFWDEGEIVVDPHELRLPKDRTAGPYRLIAGMYLLSSGERLPLDGGGDYVELAELSLSR